MPLTTRVDPIVTDLLNGISQGEPLSGERYAVLEAMGGVLKVAGAKVTARVRPTLDQVLIHDVCLGTLIGCFREVV